MPQEGLGYTLALLSLVGVALFQVFPKIDRVKRTGIHHIIFNLYFLIGVILFCGVTTICLLFWGTYSLSFTSLGMLSGIMLGIGSVFVWIALAHMGLSHTTAIFSGIAAVTGFLEGLIIGETPYDVGLAIFSLIVLLIAIFGIGFNESAVNVLSSMCGQDIELKVKRFDKTPRANNNNNNNDNNDNNTDNNDNDNSKNDDGNTVTDTENENETKDVVEEEPLLDSGNNATITGSHVSNALKSRIVGVGCAVAGGIIFGTMGLPEEFVDESERNLYFLPSFGIGALIVLVFNLLYAMYLKMTTNFEFKKFDSDDAGGVTVIDDDDDTMAAGGAGAGPVGAAGTQSYPQQSIFSSITLQYGIPGLMNPPFYVYQCFGPGLCSGVIWAFSFLCTLYAEDLLSYDLAIPIRESALGLTAFIGIFWFDEIPNLRARTFVLICVIAAIAACFGLALGLYD